MAFLRINSVRVAANTLIVFSALTVTGSLPQNELGDSEEPWIPSESVLQLYKDHQQRLALSTNNVTDMGDEELVRQMRDILAWIPPKYIATNFPYHFLGYSYEGNPVWIGEWGKYDMNDLIRQGPEMIAALDNYTEQAFLRILKSIDGAQAPNGEIRILEDIVDLEGMNINKLSHPQAIELVYKFTQRYVGTGMFILRSATVINSNYFVERMMDFFRPILGQLMERVEIFGPDRRKWQRRLRELLPSSSLPLRYGGDRKNFKPVQTFR